MRLKILYILFVSTCRRIKPNTSRFQQNILNFMLLNKKGLNFLLQFQIMVGT